MKAGCSSVRLECWSGGPKVAGSSPVIPTKGGSSLCKRAAFFVFAATGAPSRRGVSVVGVRCVRALRSYFVVPDRKRGRGWSRAPGGAVGLRGRDGFAGLAARRFKGASGAGMGTRCMDGACDGRTGGGKGMRGEDLSPPRAYLAERFGYLRRDLSFFTSRYSSPSL